MSLRARLSRLEGKLATKEEPKGYEANMGVWLIENGHEEFIDCVRKLFRISVRDEKTEADIQEHDQVINRMEAIIASHC